MTRTLRLLVALLVATALAFTGCGGDDDDDGGDAASAADDGDQADEADEADVAADDDDVDLADLDDECLEAVQAWTGVMGAIGPAGGDDVDDSFEAFERYADAAPSEIRGDVQVIAAAFRTYMAVLEESGYDMDSGEQPTGDQMEALTEAAEELSSPEVTEANERLSAYFEEHCGG